MIEFVIALSILAVPVGIAVAHTATTKRDAITTIDSEATEESEAFYPNGYGGENPGIGYW